MPRPPSSSSSAATAANGPASIVDLPSNSDPSRKHHLHHSSSSAAASASATGAESKSSRHVTDLSPSMSSSPSRSSGVNRASGSSSMSMPPHPGLLSPGVRIGMSSAANGTSARTSARDNDLLASVDELKEYKDEGDADAENKSSAENLDEEKRGLLTGLLTEAEQGKLFRDASFAKAIYSSIGSSLPATFDGDVAAAFRDYYGIHRPVPFSPFFSPYHHQYAHHHAAAAASSYLNPYGTGPTQHPGAPASPASATGFGAGMTSLLPSATQRLYGSNPYSSGSSNPYDHLQHPSSAAAAAAAAAVAQHPASSFHFNTASASGLSQSSYRFPFSSPFLTPPEFPQGACFDPLLRSAPGGVCSASNSGYAAHSRHHPHHQYAAISPFCLPPPCCLTPAGAAAAAALGATFPVGAALAAARDYFPGPPTPLHSPVAPTAGISSTYPGVSHPALVANTSNVGDIEERFMPSALQPPPPCCPPSPSGDGSRALHAWYPRHCPPAAGNGASSSLNQPLLTTNGSGSARESSSAASVISSSSPGAVGTDVDFRSASDSSSGLRHRPDHARRQSGLAGFRPGGSAFRSSISGSSLLRNEHRFFGGLAGARRSSKSSSMSSVGLGQFGPHQHGLGLNGGSNASGSQHHVKKPLNAFMLFMKEMRSKVIDECTLKESAAINQILGRKWHSLDRTEQARYYEMARREKLMHRQLFPGWTARENYAAIARKVKRKLSASAGHHSTHYLHNGPHGGSSVGSRPLPHTLSTTNSVDRADNPNAKKCRARYGLEHQNRWCKPCRRKKRCIRFLDNPSDDVTGNSSTAPIVAADSTSDFCASETGNASNKNKQPQLNHSSSSSASPPKTSSASSSFLSDQHHQPLLQTLHRSNDPAGDFLPPRLDGTSGINAGSGSWLSPMTSGGSSLLSPLPSRYHVSPSSSSAAASVAAAVVR